MEVGTGYRIGMPIGLWVCGAQRILTVDLNPYLKIELVRKDLEYIKNNFDAISNIFETVNDSVEWRERLEWIKRTDFESIDVLDAFNIEYYAPAKAENLKHVHNKSIDLHVSYTVLEHIPAPVIRNIIKEGKRILKDEGLFVHIVDLTDHFSHSDTSITSINFYQYSDTMWKILAGNKFMYQNRMLPDEYLELFTNEEVRVQIVNKVLDENAHSQMGTDFKLNNFFQEFSHETPAVSHIQIVAR